MFSSLSLASQERIMKARHYIASIQNAADKNLKKAIRCRLDGTVLHKPSSVLTRWVRAKLWLGGDSQSVKLKTRGRHLRRSQFARVGQQITSPGHPPSSPRATNGTDDAAMGSDPCCRLKVDRGCCSRSYDCASTVEERVCSNDRRVNQNGG